MLFQNDYHKLVATPTPYQAGMLMVAVFDYTFAEDFETTDKLELGALPAGCKIVDGYAVGGAGIAATTTFDIGFMSGEVGVDDDTRTVGDQIFDGVDIDQAAVRIANVDVLNDADAAAAPSATHRSIGLVTGVATITGGATATIRLVILYTMP